MKFFSKANKDITPVKAAWVEGHEQGRKTERELLKFKLEKILEQLQELIKNDL